jgi:hypothetical protein
MFGERLLYSNVSNVLLPVLQGFSGCFVDAFVYRNGVIVAGDEWCMLLRSVLTTPRGQLGQDFFSWGKGNFAEFNGGSYVAIS